MRTTTTLVFIALILSFAARAQPDSSALVNARWTTTTIAPKITWRTVHFTHHDLFGANQYLTVIEIRKKAKAFRLAVAYSDSLETTSQLADGRNALAGINGSFFKMRGPDPDNRKDLNGVPKLEPSLTDHNRSVVYLRQGGETIAENNPNARRRGRDNQGTLVIRKGKLSIMQPDSVDMNWEHRLKGEDVLSSGPLMLLHGQNLPIANDAFCNDRHPRTAVAKKADGTIILFVVDGRADLSAGMSIPELQRTLRWLGCIDALNLDGGGSTAMYVRGQPDGGVVNHPSDNKKFDHLGEREVANALLLLPGK